MISVFSPPPKTPTSAAAPLKSKFLSVIAVFSFVFSTALIAQERNLDIDALGLEVRLETPIVSPDGSLVIVSISTADYEDNRFDQTLVLVNTTSGEHRDLTPHRPDVSQPRWSPAGDQVAFLDLVKESDEVGKRKQVFALHLDGGEARQVTDAERGVKTFAWSADGGGAGQILSLSLKSFILGLKLSSY